MQSNFRYFLLNASVLENFATMSGALNYERHFRRSYFAHIFVRKAEIIFTIFIVSTMQAVMQINYTPVFKLIVR